MAYDAKTNWQYEDIVTESDLNRIETGIKNVEQGLNSYFATTNSGNAYSITITPALTSYAEGLTVRLKINADSTGTATINIDGLGAKAIKKANGSNVTNLKVNGIYSLVYNGLDFILQGEGGEGTAVVTDVLATKTFTNDTGDTLTGTMPNRAGDTVCIASEVSGTTLKLRASNGYRDGVDDNVTISDVDFVAANIKSGVNIFGIDGSYTAKRFATGTVSHGASPTTITVSGIAFRPSYVIITLKNPVDSTHQSSINTLIYNGFPIYTTESLTAYRAKISDDVGSQEALLDTTQSITSDGFSFATSFATSVTVTYDWIAFE